jgi:hypothetical protein
MTKIIPNALVNTMLKDRSVRTSITKDSFLYFFHFYYAHYVKYETADFQKEIIHNLEKSTTENLYVVAFVYMFLKLYLIVLPIFFAFDMIWLGIGLRTPQYACTHDHRKRQSPKKTHSLSPPRSNTDLAFVGPYPVH